MAELQQVVILAGGLATRLRPLTHSLPKALVRVHGRPFLDYQLEWLRRQGTRDVLILLGYLGEQIVEHVGDGSSFDLQVRYQFDGGRLLGTGGALRAALHLLEPAFIVLNGDTFVDLDLTAFGRAFLASRCQAGLAVCDPALLGAQANVAVEGERVVAYDKTGADPASRLVHLGTTAFLSSAITRLALGQPADMGAVLAHSLSDDCVLAWQTDRLVYDIGTPAGLARFADAQIGLQLEPAAKRASSTTQTA